MGKSWTCPFCKRPTTITEHDIAESSFWMSIANKHGPKGLFSTVVVCPNEKCKEYSLAVSLYDAEFSRTWRTKETALKHWNLIPPSSAKVFPESVPKPIRADYEEACLIRDLSPKASATLSRRCLQGMIRDFWNIKKRRLIDEIAALESKVHPETWNAIDGVRKIGNIGAHMEKDINLIISVDANEAQQLLDLIEMLVDDWYVERDARSERVKKIEQMVAAKERARTNASEQPK